MIPPGEFRSRASMLTPDNPDETPAAIRLRWKERDERSKLRKSARKKGPARKLRLPNADLRTLISRVVLSDPSLGTLDLTNHAQVIGLSGAQKLKALDKLSYGSGLQMIKLVSVSLDNACAPSLARLFKSQHKLECVSFEGMHRHQTTCFGLNPSRAHPTRRTQAHPTQPM